MAQPTKTSFDNGSTTTNASSYATTSKTFVANRLYLVFFNGTAANIVTPTSVKWTTNGTAWTQMKVSASGSQAAQIGCYAAIGLAITDTVTVSYGAQSVTGFDWVIVESTGFAAGLANAIPTGQIGIAGPTSSGTPSASLVAAPLVDSLTLGFSYQETNAAFTAGTNFTKLQETAGHINPGSRAAVEADNGTAQQTCNWTITSATWFAMAVEVRAATARSRLYVSNEAVRRASRW